MEDEFYELIEYLFELLTFYFTIAIIVQKLLNGSTFHYTGHSLRTIFTVNGKTTK